MVVICEKKVYNKKMLFCFLILCDRKAEKCMQLYKHFPGLILNSCFKSYLSPTQICIINASQSYPAGFYLKFALPCSNHMKRRNVSNNFLLLENTYKPWSLFLTFSRNYTTDLHLARLSLVSSIKETDKSLSIPTLFNIRYQLVTKFETVQHLCCIASANNCFFYCEYCRQLQECYY